jgi:hypothetical protein
VDFQVDETPVVTSNRIADPNWTDDDVWFDAGPLDSDKQHMLVMRYLGNEREFLFDYIQYEDTIIATSTTTSSSNYASYFTTTVLTRSTSSAASTSSSGSIGVNPGAFAGAVVGAGIGIAAIMLFGLFLYDRRRRKRKLALSMSRDPPMNAVSG